MDAASDVGILGPAVLLRWLAVGRQRGDCHVVRRFVEDQFQPADVAAIDATRSPSVAIMIEWGLARRTFPRHEVVDGTINPIPNQGRKL